MRWNKVFKGAGLLGFAGMLMLGGPSSGWAQGPAGAVASGQSDAQNDAQIQADVMKTLANKKFKEVKCSVRNGIVTLTGTVDIYSAKRDADNRVHHRKNVRGVENLIEVAGPTVEDVTLRNKLGEKLAYDRVGYGTTAFNAATMTAITSAPPKLSMCIPGRSAAATISAIPVPIQDTIREYSRRRGRTG